MTDTTNDASAIIEAIKSLSGAELVDLPGGRIGAIMPTSKTIVSIKKLVDEYLPAPERIETKATALSAQSFADYLNRFKRAESAVFVKDDAQSPAMLGMLDYHARAADVDMPQFCRHRVAYAFPLSDEMKAWRAQSAAGLIGQEAFATFLQDRAHDIANPPLDWMQVDAAEVKMILDLLNLHDDKGQIDDGADAEALAVEGDDDNDERYIPRSALYKLRRIRWGSVQRLIAMARGIEIAANGKATAGYNPATGERSVSFQEEHETRNAAGRKIYVPDAFFLNVPVFEAGPRHLMPVRLRYRVTGGTVKWAIELVDAPRMVRLAVRAAATDVAQQTGLPVFYGAPEA